MNVDAVLAARRSCRAYSATPIEPDVLAAVLDAARRAPSAGNTWALDLVVLEGAAQTSAYWEVTLPVGPRRDRFPWPALLVAPVLVLPYVRPDAYVERYAEPDKAGTGLGDSTDRWPVPYWWVDAGAAAMAMLTAATAHGLGSLLFGQFDHADALRSRFGVPADRAAIGTLAMGFPAAGEQRRSVSARRRRPDLEHIVHRGGW